MPSAAAALTSCEMVMIAVIQMRNRMEHLDSRFPPFNAVYPQAIPTDATLVAGFSRTKLMGGDLQIFYERPIRSLPLLPGRHAQDGRRVDRRDEPGRVLGIPKNLPAALSDAERPAHQRLRRRCAKADDHLRFDHREFGRQPRLAGLDLARAGLAVNAALAAPLPFEMFHRVGDVDLSSISA